jgi:hypothetical protein
MLKGQLHDIFDPWFFHQSTPPRALIHGLKLSCMWPNTKKSTTFEFQRGQWPRWNRFGGVIGPDEIYMPRWNLKSSFLANNFVLKGVKVIVPAETYFDDFRSDYLGEYEVICKTALASESGP